MTDSSEPAKEGGMPRTLPATPKGEEPEVEGKGVAPAGFDLDLGDVSAEESDWEVSQRKMTLLVSWPSSLRRLTGDAKVVGSNPDTALISFGKMLTCTCYSPPRC